MRRITAGIGVLAIAAITACSDDDGTGITLEGFQAVLTGEEEAPEPVETDAEGGVGFGWDGTTMGFVIDLFTIDDVTAAHIHDGEVGEPGPVVVTLFTVDPPDSVDDQGIRLTGSFTAPDEGVDITMDDLLELMRSGGAYVNVHTLANPSGEIRGQIEPVEEP